uniref:Uncharacterized protein n=1 Tax=Onchocerca volvulus TaxID=6282 RepID=A0A8R1XTV0_ONCVO
MTKTLELIIPTTQICCLSPSAVSPISSINILIPVPYDFTFPETDSLGGFPDSAYFGYFTQYLGPASINGICPAGVNINGQCWYNSIGNTKR